MHVKNMLSKGLNLDSDLQIVLEQLPLDGSTQKTCFKLVGIIDFFKRVILVTNP